MLHNSWHFTNLPLNFFAQFCSPLCILGWLFFILCPPFDPNQRHNTFFYFLSSRTQWWRIIACRRIWLQPFEIHVCFKKFSLAAAPIALTAPCLFLTHLALLFSFLSFLFPLPAQEQKITFITSLTFCLFVFYMYLYSLIFCPQSSFSAGKQSTEGASRLGSDPCASFSGYYCGQVIQFSVPQLPVL